MSKKTQKSSHIPFSAMIQPYASVYNPEEFPTTTFGSSNPVIRCDDCRGYLSPFTMFLDQGNKFKCNLC
jgi:protein transport protein SEC24